MPPKNNPIYGYDLIIPEKNNSKENIMSFFTEYCKAWVFQLEKGEETGYLHFQCRLSLKDKLREMNMRQLVKQVLGEARVLPTVTENFKNKNFDYVMKDDTRIDGPWSDKDEKPYYIQKKFRGNITWQPWQQSVMNMINNEVNDRTVNVIVNLSGNIGKSFLSMYLMTFRKAIRIPAQPEARDIMRMIMDQPKSSCYFVDLPRASSKNNQNAIYSGLEEIKNGYCYDDRYKFKNEIFEPPHVWVFTNEIPAENLLSKDKWTLWTVNFNKELIKVENITDIV